MAESSVPVDLFNPGQVFACLGILEAAEVLLGNTMAAFDWCGSSSIFRITTLSDKQPVERVMRFLDEANIVTHAPAGSANIGRWKEKWGKAPKENQPGMPFPFPDPDSPATLPVVLRDGKGNEISLNYWGRDTTKRENVKFWAGSGGYPGAVILRDAMDLVRGKTRQHVNDPYALSAPQSSSFRFDWRRDYIPAQAGFSPNKHRGKISMVGFPLVEILAAIGVTNARPARTSRRNKLEYRYGVLGAGHGRWFDPIFLRAALDGSDCPIPGVPIRRFIMHLDWPGQPGQARCITHVTEEEISQ